MKIFLEKFWALNNFFFSEIYIKVIGYAHCDFKSIKHDQHVHGHENYIDRKIKLLGVAELTEGTHRFEGNFTIPYNVPSSIECLNGHWKEASGCIRYKVEVYVNRLGQLVSTFESPFNVVCPLNLNSMSPEYHVPVMQEICRVSLENIYKIKEWKLWFKNYLFVKILI